MSSPPAELLKGADADAPNKRKLRVAVLMGGTSSEREVSLSTGRMIAGALDTQKYDVIAIDTQDLGTLAANNNRVNSLPAKHNNFPATAKAVTPAAPAFEKFEKYEEAADIEDAAGTSANGEETTSSNHSIQRAASAVLPPDIVFIALHGRGGEDGAVQGMLEVLGLPYTGSGILASALAMDKTMSKQLFRGADIPVAAEIALRRGQGATGSEPGGQNLRARIQDALGGFPVFVKPNAEGSTVGGTLVADAERLDEALDYAFRYDDVVLIEKYLRGMEITVGVLGNTGGELQALPVVEIVPKSAFYDYESKYADGGSDHIIPARLSDAQTRQAQQIALQCHTLLGCRGMSRADFIVTPDGPFLLEVNTIPGMTPTSLLPQAAAHAGILFPALLDRLIASALTVS